MGLNAAQFVQLAVQAIGHHTAIANQIGGLFLQSLLQHFTQAHRRQQGLVNLA